MTLRVNGQDQELPDGLTLRQLVERLGMAQAAVAAEVNKQLVPRRHHETHILQHGDAVELVSLVGGG